MDREITVTLDNLTLGDLEKLDSGQFTPMLQVFYKCVKIAGIPDDEQEQAIKDLNWKHLKDIGEAIREAVERETNPVIDGKN